MAISFPRHLTFYNMYFQLILFRKRLRYLTETTGKGGNVTELGKEIIQFLKDEKDVTDVIDILGSSGHGIKKAKHTCVLKYSNPPPQLWMDKCI